MPKKCIVCGEDAVYGIKDTSNYYCDECAAENFSDLAMLVKVEEIARKLKEKLDMMVQEKADEEAQDNNS